MPARAAGQRFIASHRQQASDHAHPSMLPLPSPAPVFTAAAIDTATGHLAGFRASSANKKCRRLKQLRHR